MKKAEAFIKLLGITDGSVKVVEKVVNGVPTIAFVFKDGAALANFASALSSFKNGLGPVAFALSEFVGFLNLTTGKWNAENFMTDLTINSAGLVVPQVGMLWIFLQSVSAQNYPQNLPNHQNAVCPVDNTNVVIPYKNH